MSPGTRLAAAPTRAHLLTTALLLLASLLASACADDAAQGSAQDASGDAQDASGDTQDTANTSDTTGQPQMVLKVALYPYIPDAAGDQYAALTQAIEAGFEAAHPDVDLRLRAIDQADDFYGVEQLTAWLTNDPTRDVVGAQGYHVVEIDGLLLSALVEAQAVSPWQTAWDATGWHPAAVESGLSQGQRYGLPHLMCGHFIFSRDPAVGAATDAASLVAALEANPSPAPNLTGNFLGSWNLPALYLDGLLDTYDPQAMTDAFGAPLDPTVVATMGAVVGQCSDGLGRNPCIDGTFDDDYEDAALRFADGRADATFGYSERLHTLVKLGVDPTEIALTSLPLGDGKRAAVFVNNLVKRADCAGACEDAAARFAAYLTDPAVVAALLLSKDAAEGATPRYLIPGHAAVFEAEGVRQDPIYQRLRAEVDGAVVFPDERFPSERSALRDLLVDALSPPPP